MEELLLLLLLSGALDD